MKFRSIAVAVALAASFTQVCACGPNFPAELLQDRAATLDDLPEGAFSFEASRLVAVAQRLPVFDQRDAYGQPDPQKPTRDSVERGWWGDRHDRIAQLREAANATAAFAASAGLPSEVRQYTAGAVAFAQGDLREAGERFQAVLDLPAEERAHYAVWAQYMLGRIAHAQHRKADAEADFAAVRSRIAQGAQDPLGLGAASLGEQARVHLEAGEDAPAVALYAQQAALGSVAGGESLLLVARAIFADDARLQRAATDPLVQRLLVAYLLSRAGEAGGAYDDAGVMKPVQPAPPKIARFLAAVEHFGLDRVEGADRLAALAYRSGDYELAAKFATKDGSGLSWWVRAKLALRAGDASAAAQAYAQAAKAFPADEQWGTSHMTMYDPVRPQCRVEGEHGTLALSRGEYLQAMEHLYNAASRYWPDAAYVAERVLSIDELKDFVDAHTGAAPLPAQRNGDEDSGLGTPPSSAASLRALLARRLLRDDRFDESLRYFDDATLRAKAQSYVDARLAALRGERIEQAQAWYAAARAARFDGMGLLGYELDPDYQIYGGDFDTNWQAHSDIGARDDIPVPAVLSGPDESARVAQSSAQPLRRFHYRYNAVYFVEQAADLLPPRTQAFAAVLCEATSWLIDRDPPVAQQVYARYVKEGPHVPWAATFGRSCPAPDFMSAAKRLHKERVAHYRHLARHSLPHVAAVGALLIVVLAVFAQRRRARRAGTAEDRS
jgi:hypothetical protein